MRVGSNASFTITCKLKITRVMYYDNLSKEREHLGAPRLSVTIVEETDAETKEVYITVLLPYIHN